MIKIEEEVLLRSIESAYIEYQKARQINNKIRAHKIYGWFSALERIVEIYVPELLPRIKALRKRHSIDIDPDDLDTPTFLRRKFNFQNNS